SSLSLRSSPRPTPLFPYTTLFRSIQSSEPTGSVVTKPPSLARNQPSVVPSPSLCTPGLPVYLTVTVNADPALIGDRGVITSLLRSEEHTSELQSLRHLVCRLLLEK